MPTINPRVNVTLSPTLYALVESLAKHQRVSRSMVLRELLEAAEPGLAQVVAMMEAAEEMNEAARQRLKADLGDTINSLEAKRDQALALAAGVTADLVAQAEAIKGRRPGRAATASGARRRPTRPAVNEPERPKRAGRPPSSKRGVKS